MNVGILVKVSPNENIWKNGIIQNCIYFYDLLSLAPSVNTVYFIQVGNSDEFKDSTFLLEDYNHLFLNENTKDQVRKEINVLFSLGAFISNQEIAFYKEINDNKYVKYIAGNQFVFEIESIIYTGLKGSPELKINSVDSCEEEHIHDEIWYIPQHDFHNKDYLEIKYNSKSRCVPFIWSSQFIDHSIDIFIERGQTPYFKDAQFDQWRIISFEPNFSILKNMMPIIYAVEHAYRIMGNKDKFKSLMITNAAGHKTNNNLITVIRNLSIFKDNKITFESRYPITSILSRYPGIVISHQWGNALNYSYLDACYLGAPLIHNAHICKDLGFYYNEWEIKDASKIVLDIIDQDFNRNEYLINQRKIIKRYTIENKEMINQYDLLLKNLFHKNEIDKKEYDWKTNLLK